MKTRYMILIVVMMATCLMSAYAQNLNEAMLKSLQFRKTV